MLSKVERGKQNILLDNIKLECNEENQKKNNKREFIHEERDCTQNKKK